MNQPHLQFHHFGLAVKRPDEARVYVQALGYLVQEYVFDATRNVHLQMCRHPSQPAVEIIWPGEARGPVDKLTQKNPAGIIYHICYETTDLAAALQVFEAAGLQPVCISPPTPAPLFGGRKVSFYNVLGVGLIEILEDR